MRNPCRSCRKCWLFENKGSGCLGSDPAKLMAEDILFPFSGGSVCFFTFLISIFFYVMKIILANKFYYRRGGDCVYMLSLERLLAAYGHEVAVFAMDYPENLESPWSSYFPSEVKFRPGPGMMEALMRPFGTREVRTKFNALLHDFRPDVVHLNNIH